MIIYLGNYSHFRISLTLIAESRFLYINKFLNISFLSIHSEYRLFIKINFGFSFYHNFFTTINKSLLFTSQGNSYNYAIYTHGFFTHGNIL